MIRTAVLATLAALSAAQLGGGISDQDASDPKYTEIAWQAVQDKAINGAGRANFFVPVKILRFNVSTFREPIFKDTQAVLSAKVQVVAGSNTILEVVVGESNCASKEVQVNQLSAAKCQFKSGGSRELYKVELWEKSWENFKQFTISKIRDVPASEKI